jgi:multisubunit Na+/H+ antiporter MnhF subunit
VAAFLVVALLVLGAAMTLATIRAIEGPTGFDRALALDALLLDVVGAVLVLSIRLATDAFLDAILAIALVGFLGTIAFAAYLEGVGDE